MNTPLPRGQKKRTPVARRQPNISQTGGVGKSPKTSKKIHTAGHGFPPNAYRSESSDSREHPQKQQLFRQTGGEDAGEAPPHGLHGKGTPPPTKVIRRAHPGAAAASPMNLGASSGGRPNSSPHPSPHRTGSRTLVGEKGVGTPGYPRGPKHRGGSGVDPLSRSAPMRTGSSNGEAAHATGPHKTPNHSYGGRQPKATPAHQSPAASWKGRSDGAGLRLGVPNGGSHGIGGHNLFPQLDDSGNDGSKNPAGSSQPSPVTQGPVAGVSLLKGRRPYMEDEHRVVMRLESLEGSSAQDGTTTGFFGLFDGHAGGRCSKAVSQILPGNVAREPEMQSGLTAAIQKGFAKTNQEWLRRAERYNMNDGSTCITVFVRGRYIVVANVGDSRCVLGSSGKAVPMSRDHKPNRPEERRRIAAAGGHVVVSLGVHRVNGVLAVSRAFGDKNMRPAIKADPEIKEKALEVGDQFLILGTDGLWDMVTNQEAVNVVARGLDDLGVQGCAEMLTTIAIRRGSMDNTSAMVIDLRSLTDATRKGSAHRFPPTESGGNLAAMTAPPAVEASGAPSPSPPKAASANGMSGYRYSRNP